MYINEKCGENLVALEVNDLVAIVSYKSKRGHVYAARITKDGRMNAYNHDQVPYLDFTDFVSNTRVPIKFLQILDIAYKLMNA